MDLSRIEIILVEDNPDDAFLTINAFKKLGLENSVILLKNGAEALDFLLNAGELYGKKYQFKSNLILLDLKLPKVDGIEVLKAIKKDDKTKGIPVVILTGAENDPIVYTCKELGADAFIIKPVTPEGFVKVVNDLRGYWE